MLMHAIKHAGGGGEGRYTDTVRESAKKIDFGRVTVLTVPIYLLLAIWYREW